MNKPFEIATVIPTYNRKHTLQRAIDSVYDQKYSSNEIIVVDDGSTDGTDEWIKTKYPKIILLSQSNSGVSSARNLGIKAAKSEWIALLDSDDEWLPEKLQKQVKFIQSNSDNLCCHTNEIWIRNGIKINQMKKHQKYGGNIFYKCLDMCRISPSSVLFHKSILDQTGDFDESFKVCEDYDLWLRISAKYSILYLDIPLIKKYGGHEDQLSKVSNGIEKYRIDVLEKLIKDNFSDEHLTGIRSMLIRKWKIYSKGAKKRGKMNQYNFALKRIDELSSEA